MERLIFPGHIGTLDYIIPAIQTYAEANDWLSTDEYIKREFEILKANHVESTMKADRTDYTKDAEIPRYFGLVERKVPFDIKSDCRITELGKKFHEAYINKEEDKLHETIICSLEQTTFGRNNEGCPNSDCSLEVPNILVVASLMLNGVTRQEYASILYKMLHNNYSLVNALVHVKISRITNKGLGDMVRVDNKVIPFFLNINFLTEENKLLKLNENVVEKYSERISRLRIFNNEKESLGNEDVVISNGSKNIDQPLQQIYYGAPGTGKSFEVDKEIKNIMLSSIKDDNEKDNHIIRTIFHPESDYSTFVGCYKPRKVNETDITYDFTPQAFTKAYIAAWNDPDEKYFLVIEELSRGNCAAIFGDIFQLLDRDDDNTSKYEITPDTDLQNYLAQNLTNEEIPANVKTGKKLKLPSNLYIWATMNTSDKSVFPMDSAFKRRWRWKYVRISYDEGIESNGYTFKIAQKEYNWINFLRKINKEIKAKTDSEDKQMGNFFIKGNIDEDTFVDKVMFYLWSEVGKENYKTSDALFLYKNTDEQEIDFSFGELYESNRSSILIGFMQLLDEKYPDYPRILEEQLQQNDNGESKEK